MPYHRRGRQNFAHQLARTAKRELPLRSSDPRAVAYHEAGHAVVGLRLGLELLGTDVLSDDTGGRGHNGFSSAGCRIRHRTGPATARERDFVDRTIVTYLAGHAAESRLGVADAAGSGFDENDVLQSWVSLLSDVDEEQLAAITLSRQNATSMLEEPGVWRAVGIVAGRLEVARRLDAEEVRSLTRLTGQPATDR